MNLDDVPYTDAEAAEAWQWVSRHGPGNAWTATAGTAARMIGRLLAERERLLRVAENARGKMQADTLPREAAACGTPSGPSSAMSSMRTPRSSC